MTAALTFEQAWRIQGAVANVAAAPRPLAAAGHQRCEIAIAARRASNECAVAYLAAAAAPASPPSRRP